MVCGSYRPLHENFLSLQHSLTDYELYERLFRTINTNKDLRSLGLGLLIFWLWRVELVSIGRVVKYCRQFLKPSCAVPETMVTLEYSNSTGFALKPELLRKKIAFSRSFGFSLIWYLACKKGQFFLRKGKKRKVKSVYEPIVAHQAGAYPVSVAWSY